MTRLVPTMGSSTHQATDAGTMKPAGLPAVRVVLSADPLGRALGLPLNHTKANMTILFRLNLINMIK